MKTRLILVACVAFLAACGGSTAVTNPNTTVASASSTAGSASTPAVVGQAGATLTAEQTTAVQAYRQCLSDNGARTGRGGGQAPPAGSTGDQAPTTIGQAPVGADGQPQGSRAGGPPVSVDPAVLKKAQEACASQLPPGMDATTAMTAGRGQGGQTGQGGARGGFDPTVIAAYTSCLKDNGVTIADAPVSTTAPSTTVVSTESTTPGQRGQRGVGGGVFGNIDRTTPEFIAANEKCKVLLPNNGEGFGAGGAGGPGPQPGGSTSTTTVAK